MNLNQLSLSSALAPRFTIGVRVNDGCMDEVVDGLHFEVSCYEIMISEGFWTWTLMLR